MFTGRGRPSREIAGLFAGPIAFAGLLATNPFGMPAAAGAVLAATLWIAIWWVTEAVPIYAASLLPIVLFPITGVTTIAEATAPYADPIVFLLLGGFLLALAIERWDLHERFALQVMLLAGSSARRLVFAFMLSTAVLSMWISNTATAMMMVPIGAAVIVQFASLADRSDGAGHIVAQADRSTADLPTSRFGLAVMLGIAYGASIGGAATLIGSPPNAIFAGVAESALGVQIGFLEWMVFAAPVSAGFLGLAWAVLMVALPPEVDRLEGHGVLADRLEQLGPMRPAERRVLLVFGAVVTAWLARPFLLEPVVPAITDPVIAIGGAIALFVMPAGEEQDTRLLAWDASDRLPWGVLVLLGAGFSIASAFQASGLDAWIAGLVAGVGGLPLPIMITLIAAAVIFLTEVNSNTATAAVFIPVMVGIGAAVGIDPMIPMAVTALAASYAFMLPVATPPNAIVFGSGYMTVPQMARIGVWLNLLAIVLVVLVATVWLPTALG